MSADALDLPQAGDLTGADEETRVRPSTEKAIASEASLVKTIHRDANDVRLLLSIASSGVILTLLLLASLACNIWMYYRRPDRIVVDRTAAGDRILTVNDQMIGSAVSIGPDRPGDGDKRTLANKFSESLYGVDPRTREKDIERALRMMVPQSAKALVDLMKKKGELERQHAESWQVVWRPQVTTVDRIDPYKVNVIGSQEITKIISGATRPETRQLIFSLKLVADPQQRADRNQNTGFLVADILDYQEIAGSSSAPVSSLATSGSAPESPRP